MNIFKTSTCIVLVFFAIASNVFAQPKGVALRDKNMVFIFEDDKNIFNLISTSIKPYQDSANIFTFDLRQDYKVPDEKNPEDIGLNLHYMAWCDKDRIGAPMVQHLRGDNLIGKLEPLNFNGAIDNPASNTYQRKALDYVCKSRLNDKSKKSNIEQQKKVDPVPPLASPPIQFKNSQNNSGATKSGNAALPQADIGKFRIIYLPDADLHYPSFSKRSGEQGTVVVRLIIDETGVVEDVQLLQSSSFPRLDRAAVDIGKKYRFTPFILNGKPTKISTNLMIKFNLKDDESKGIKPKFEKNPLTTGG